MDSVHYTEIVEAAPLRPIVQFRSEVGDGGSQRRGECPGGPLQPNPCLGIVQGGGQRRPDLTPCAGESDERIFDLGLGGPILGRNLVVYPAEMVGERGEF